LRELDWMAKGRLQAAWAQTSSLMALLATIHRDPKKHRKPYKPDEFNPYRQKKKRQGPATKEDLAFMKEMFEGMRKK